MASLHITAPRRVRKTFAPFAQIVALATRLRHPREPDLSHLDAHLLDDIGLPPDDPRRLPRRPWLRTDWQPRG